MNKIRVLVYAALCSVLCTTALVAQTPTVTVVSGNGQLICEICIQTLFPFYDPLVIQVTDANGPVVNTQVQWTVTSGNAYFGSGGFGTNSVTSFTDSNGMTSEPIGQPAIVQAGTQFGATSTITATAGGVTVTFNESQAAPVVPGPGTIDVSPNYANAPQTGSVIEGVAGSAGPSFTMGVNAISGAGVPNLSLFLVNLDNTTSPPTYTIGPSTKVPSVYCKTQPGAGLYTALTGTSGVATCQMVFGPVKGSGTYYIVTGGAPSATAGKPADSNFISGVRSIVVDPATIGGVTVVSGNNQIGVAGSQLTALVAEVMDTSSRPLSGQQVTWSSSPASAIQLNNVTSLSDSDGLVKVLNPVLTTSAAGAITVTATAISNPNAVATFTINASIPVTVSSLTVQSGSTPQTAVEGAAFANPLAVMVMGSDGRPVSGESVTFNASGPVTLSASSTTTSSSGVAQVTATAGATPGTATVTAAIGGLSQVFNLTVVPRGPNLTASAFLNGADGQVGSISPCGIGVISGAGVATGGSGMPPVVGPLPYSVGTDSVSFGASPNQLSAPIFSVSNTAGQQPQIMFLVPCEVTPGTVPVTVTVNGGSQTLNVNVLAASPGIFQWTNPDGVMRAVIERPDGSFVSNSNPARPGDTVTVFVTGLGAVSPQIGTNGLPIPNTPSTANGTVIVGIQNQGVPVVSAQLSPELIGVYTVQFVVPSGSPQGDNVVFSVGVVPVGATSANYSLGTAIPIHQ